MCEVEEFDFVNACVQEVEVQGRHFCVSVSKDTSSEKVCVCVCVRKREKKKKRKRARASEARTRRPDRGEHKQVLAYIITDEALRCALVAQPEKAVELCKAVAPSQQDFEDLLLADRQQTYMHQLDKARLVAEQPFKDLVSFYNEIVAIHNHHVSKGAIATDNKTAKKLKSIKPIPDAGMGH